MKKHWIYILLLCLCMTGCTLTKEDSLLDEQQVYKKDTNANIHIYIEDRAYANAMKKLWDTSYPDVASAIHITSKKENTVTYDIEWIKDSDINDREHELYDISELSNHIQFGVEDHLQYREQYFLPMEGRGLLFVYNEEELTKRKGSKEDLQHFETMETLGNHVYYHNRKEDYVYPFIFTPHDDSTMSWLKRDVLYTNIATYREIDDTITLLDDQLQQYDFYKNGTYVCGLLLNDGSYTNTELYKKGKLHFMKMPDYKGVHYAPIVDTYGFVVSKRTKYPSTALAFLQLARSEKGMNAFIESTNKTPLMKDEDIKDFFVFDHTRKEMIQAMNGSQLRDSWITSHTDEKNFYGILQNSLYSKESNASIQNQIKKVIQQWN